MNPRDLKWKEKVNDFLNICGDEIRKTTSIGKKMLSASKTNSLLHEGYEELGRMTFNALKSGELDWSSEKVAETIEKIEQAEEDLKAIEDEVKKIKLASGPVDISKSEQQTRPSQEPAAKSNPEDDKDQ